MGIHTLAYPSLKENHIRHRSRFHGRLHPVTLDQTLFFTTNSLLRVVQELAMTAHVLSTSTRGLKYFENSIPVPKPADVEHRQFIEAHVSLATVLGSDNLPVDAINAYTSLDFVGREEFPWSIIWMHDFICLRRLHLAAQPQHLPIQRFQSTVLPVIYGWILTFFAVYSLAYLRICVAEWNHNIHSPTGPMTLAFYSLTALISTSEVFLTQQMFSEKCPAPCRVSIRAFFPLEIGEALTALRNRCL